MQPSTPSSSHDPRVARIVRRHVHDVRNYINSLDLEATLLEEELTDSEALEGVRRMRSQLRQLDASVGALSFKFAEPRPTTITAFDLFMMWKSQVTESQDESRAVEWQAPAESQLINVDPSGITSVLRELVLGAWNRSPGAVLKAAVKTSSTEVTAELREKLSRNSLAEEIVRECEHVVAVNGGRVGYTSLPDAAEAVTTLTFPVTTE